ncbi:MAG: TatD family hydrolase [Muribaculaceae bacterium]|nr:TatD family hydrolase [Muribaculaceae bacterium]
MTPVIDIHTHRLDAGPGAIISVEPHIFVPQPGRLYSVGHHPWSGIPGTLDELAQAASHPQVVAMGETGIDALRGASIAEQEELFAHHIALAQELHLPVIAHMVRTSQQLVKVWRRMHPAGIALVVHGMRGNANVARTLLDAGCYLSYGEHYNPTALAATPLNRILTETDESTMPIELIIEKIAHTLGMSPTALTSVIAHNTATLLRGVTSVKE